jgi:hypothetical protein
MTELEGVMPTTKETQTRVDVKDPRAGVERSEPGGRAQRDAGAARPLEGPALAELPGEVRDRLSDELIDELLAGARTEEEIVGPGGLLADLTPPAGGAGDVGQADRASGL